MNDAEQIKSLVTEITSVNSQMERLQELQSATTDVKQIKKYQDQIEDLNAYQLDLNNSLSERLKTASTNYSAIVGDEKYADLAKEYESAFLSIENMGKSTKEVKQNTLEHFFTSTDNQLLSNSLLDIARQGELTENVLKNLGTVSYTHLDVYKRQLKNTMIFFITCFDLFFSSYSLRPDIFVMIQFFLTEFFNHLFNPSNILIFTIDIAKNAFFRDLKNLAHRTTTIRTAFSFITHIMPALCTFYQHPKTSLFKTDSGKYVLKHYITISRLKI